MRWSRTFLSRTSDASYFTDQTELYDFWILIAYNFYFTNCSLDFKVNFSKSLLLLGWIRQIAVWSFRPAHYQCSHWQDQAIKLKSSKAWKCWKCLEMIYQWADGNGTLKHRYHSFLILNFVKNCGVYHSKCKKKIYYYHFRTDFLIFLTGMTCLRLSIFRWMCQLARKDCFYFVAYVKYGYRRNIIQIRKRPLFIYPFDPSFNSQLEVELSVSVQSYREDINLCYSSCYKLLYQLKPRRISEITKHLTFSIKFKCCRLETSLEL